MEKANKVLERISNKNASAIDGYLDTRPNWQLTTYGYEMEGRRHIFALVSRKEARFSPKFAEKVLKYQAEHVINPRGQNVGRADCVSVAGEANKKLPHLGIDSFALSTGDKSKVLPFFKDQGFGNHMINAVEREDGSCIAFDLTAHHTMDMEQGRYDVFALLATSEEELKRELKAIFGSSWE
jgi:hypothetical protein